MARYLLATKGDLACAIKLYEVNIQVSQTLYGVLHGYEITLRNAMHDRLKEHFARDDWYTRANLSPVHIRMVQETQDEAERGHPAGSTVPVGKIVAGLSLGFWTGLIAARYEQSLWQPCLRKAFPNTAVSRARAYPVLNDIKRVRNRVAMSGYLAAMGHYTPDLTQIIEQS
jgi:hypothetical protein